MAGCINFKIIVIPQKTYVSETEDAATISLLIKYIEYDLQNCGLSEVAIQVSKVKTSEDDKSPEVEEVVFEVQAKPTNIGDHKVLYNKFTEKWKVVASREKYISMVIFSDNKCFSRTHSYSHRTNYLSFSFGVLPFNNKYLEYANFPSTFINSSVDFFHDIGHIKIKYLDYEITTTYHNIKNIFINVDSSCEIFLDLCNPPLVHKVEKKHSRWNGYYETTKRIPVFTQIDVDTFGRSNVLKIVLTDLRTCEEIIGKIHFRCGRKPIYFGHISTVRTCKPQDPDLKFLPYFGCTYLLTAIIRRNFTLVSQLDYQLMEFLNQMTSLSQKDSDALEKSLTIVLSALDAGKVINYYHAILKYFEYYASHKEEVNFQHYIIPEKCCKIRRMTLTPSRQLLWAPEVMFGNRVLRNYDSEFAIRVSFRDENSSRLSIGPQFASPDIFNYAIKNPMLKGICIGKREYKFLAWSNSQIRDHGVWMYAQDQNGNSVKEIRAWMGDFSHIHTVPKYMARMGQCFSQTEEAVSVPLDSRYVRTEDDIEGGSDINNKMYCFSDGIGKISVKLAKEVRNALDHDKLCSAFQIRYGGYKGMLVVDPTLKDTDIVFRKSMKKFDSPKNIKLEIAKTSGPSPLQLNRQFITILNDMGVRHRTFLKLQEEMLRTLTDMLFDEEKAASFLETKAPAQLFSFTEISKSGINLTTEPFFRAQLLALHRHHVEKIKTHANIEIDPSEGRCMFGVLDETGLLNYGEVFVQYTEDLKGGETTKETLILKGEVLVTKNPCLLPGDVRKFQAVDIQELHHIVDCIVFPQKGKRPHPNEMAGSDLDGDEYTVLWNKDLIFHRSNYSPGHFPSSSVPEKYHITDPDIISFLVEYIQNDQIGIIANSHLAWADMKDIFSNQCEQLAQKFSYAVDFAKTGVIKKMETCDRPNNYPDFMEKNHKQTIKSKKALGKMYRVAHDFESENKDASFTYQNIQMDPHLVYPGWEKYEESAIISRNKFNSLLKTVLRNYGIQHEAEVFSAAFTKFHCRFQERKDRAEIEKVVVKSIKRLSKCMYEEFLEEFKNVANAKELADSIYQKASAWYVVTYSDKDSKFLSFPWSVSKYLANIKLSQSEQNPMYVSPIVEKMDKQIQLCYNQKQLPQYIDQNIRLNYENLCDSNIIQNALGVLLLWAQECKIIDQPPNETKGLLYRSVFVRLFYFVANKAGYVTDKKSIQNNKPMKPSAADLCLEFLKFCLTLRFYTKYEIKNLIPFEVYKYSTLSKEAVVAYHRFAVLGKFSTLYIETPWDEIETNNIQIDSKIFPQLPISQDQLRKAEEILVKYTQAEEVSMREITQTKKVVVSARGSERSLKALKCVLRKNPATLGELFTTGILP